MRNRRKNKSVKLKVQDGTIVKEKQTEEIQTKQHFVLQVHDVTAGTKTNLGGK